MSPQRHRGLLTTRLLPWAAALTSYGCVSATAVPQSPPSADAAKTFGLSEGEHLLLRPRGKPAELLGLEVQLGENGEMIVASARRPGCRVRTKSNPENWKRNYVATLDSITGVDAEVGDIAKLKYNYGSHGRVEASVRNVERLRADLDGNCGEWVIASVYVGTGARSISSTAEQSGTAGAKQAGIGASGEHSIKSAESTSFEWDAPQGWMFSVERRPQDSTPLQITAEMPPVLTDGQSYRIYVHTNKAIWLVVYYREENGEVGNLLPNKENPQVTVAAGERRPLPRMNVGLREPNLEAREWIGLCAFDDVEYAKRFAPPKGDPSPQQMKQWHAGLSEELESIPLHRYHCEEMAYRIVPKPPEETATAPGGS